MYGYSCSQIVILVIITVGFVLHIELQNIYTPAEIFFSAPKIIITAFNA